MSRFYKFKFVFIFACSFIIGLNFSLAQVIQDIRIQGNQKVDKEVILQKIISKKGARLSSKKVKKDVKNLFATNLFYDIKVRTKKVGKRVILIYTLVEKPIVSSFEFRGNDEIDDDELKEIAGIKEYAPMGVDELQLVVSKIKKLYEEQGFFLTRVSYFFEKDKKVKTSKVVIKIDEKEKVKIKQIKILGTKHILASKLKSVIETEEAGFFSFLTDSGKYNQEIFDRDLQIINFMYFNKGYVQVKVHKPEVYVSSNKKEIYITIRIDEGEQFKVGDITFSGDVLFRQAEIESKLELKPGAVFSYSVLQKDLKVLQSMYGDLGYAFVNPIPRTQIRPKRKVVNINFSIEKGPKVYIGEINVKGNYRTRDKVFRRELHLKEGEIYNETKKRESLASIKRLGYFDSVDFVTNTPHNRYNLMNIDIEAKERSNTGSASLNVGYSGLQGFLLNASINQINFLGRGQSLGVSVNFSKEEQIFNMNFTEPYIFDSNWEAGVDIYRKSRGLIDYKEKKTGGGFRLGHSLGPYLKGVFGYRIDNTNLDLLDSGDEDVFRADTVNGITSAVSLNLVYDKRNDRFLPTDGVYGRLSFEYAGLGGDLEYTKLGGNFRFYKNLFWNVTWRNNFNYGLIQSNSSSKEPPFNQLYLLGGAHTLRGFEWFSIGKRVRSEKVFGSCLGEGRPVEDCENLALRPFGGRQQLYYQTELQFPLGTVAGIQGAVFFDIGEAQDKLKFKKELRSDVGFGFRWFSPIGPLRFEWGFPLNRKKELGEKASEFHFSIGTSF